MAFTYVTVTATYETADDVAAAGRVEFTPVDQMRNGLTVVSTTVSETLDASGGLSIRLAATTDPATIPVGVTYRVVERIVGQPIRTYYVSVPHDQGATLQLADLPAGAAGGGSSGFALRAAGDYDDTTAPTDGQVITWDGTTGKFHPETVVGGSGGAVSSVNGLTGAVSISASGLGAQPIDSDLTAIAALAPADGSVLSRQGGTWAGRAPGQVKTDLSLDQVNNTSDSAKPISNATSAALAGKAPTSHTHPVGDLSATGSASSATFLRGDGVWAAVGSSAASTTPVTLTAVGGVITPNASAGSLFRYDAAGNIQLDEPTGGVNGQAVEVQVYASGGDRTLTVAGTAVTIPSGTYWWGHYSYDLPKGKWILDDSGGAGGGGSSYTDEQVRDVMGVALVAGANVTITPNDGADTITIAAATTGATGIPATIVDAKGDLIAATAADTVARLAAGTDGQVLSASAAASTGLAWSTPATQYTDELAQDAAASMVTAGVHSGVSASYVDSSNRLDLTVTGGTASPAPHPSDATLYSFGATTGTAATAPGAPTITGVTAGSGQVTVAFNPPASNGGAAVSSYTVTASPGGATATGPASPITVGGLTNGTAYTFTVTAANSAGTGPASAASSSATPAAASAPPPAAGTSTPATWWIPFGAAPHCRVTYQTGVVSGQAQVVWVASMPDVRVRSTPRETGVAPQTQNAYQAYVVDLSTGATVADSGTVLGTASSWTATTFTPVAGRRYKGFARVRATDGQWSPYSSTRFVAPTGVTRFFEDFGMVGDGTTRSGTNYAASLFQGPLRTAISACNPGDVLKSNAPGVIGTATVSGTALTSSTVSLTGRAGQKIMVYAAGKRDNSGDSYVHRTTIASVSSSTAATLSAAAPTAVTTAKIVVNYPEFWIGKIDMDGGANSQGGVTIDGTGCLFTSLDPDRAGFRTASITDMTYQNIHFWVKNTTTRGNGQNNNDCPFFVENAATVGTRIIGCYAEHSKDAGFMFFGGPTDAHVVDCTADHTMADPFHVTGTAADIQFIRQTSVYCGDDGIANIGYRTDGDAARPQRITWEAPTVLGQDWGRGLSFGGVKDALATDVTIDRGAMASFLIGADGDQANTEHVQVRGFTVTNPKTRVGLKPTYTQGSGTGSTITDDAPIKLLNNGSTVRQRDILIENGTIVDPGFAVQIISYTGGAFQDGTIILRGISLTGTVSSGTNWLDQNTYPSHVDFRGITVPAGSTPASAPTAANS